jgi:indolepyruvate ferredoxin oxidoreductase beta subunit
MDILIAAVGGQGALLAARLLSAYAVRSGHDVKVSEIHGMSQRGGSVVTHVRFGSVVHSPVIEVGRAEVVLGLELLEAARYVGYLRPGGLLLLNTQRIMPLPVLTGAERYPDGLLDSLARLPIELLCVDALEIAREAGNPKATNVVLIGALARHLQSDTEVWAAAIRDSVPSKHLELNLRAFERGYELGGAATRPGSGGDET